VVNREKRRGEGLLIRMCHGKSRDVRCEGSYIYRGIYFLGNYRSLKHLSGTGRALFVHMDKLLHELFAAEH